jgi:hypothetical protein
MAGSRSASALTAMWERRWRKAACTAREMSRGVATAKRTRRPHQDQASRAASGVSRQSAMVTAPSASRRQGSTPARA